MGSDDAYSRRIAARVRAAIDEKNLAYTAVGEQAGIPKSTFERRIKGINPFDTDELDAVAAVLGTTPEDLVAPRSRTEAA